MKKLFRTADAATLAVASAFTLAATVLRTWAISHQLNAQTGYFASGGANAAANILSVVFVALTIAWSFVSCTGKRIAFDDPKYAKISALAVGAVACFYLATQVVTLLEAEGAMSRSDVFLAVSLGCLAVGLLYFGMIFVNQDGGMELRAVGGFALVASGVFYTVHYYFLSYMPVNGELKNLHILAAVAVFMFFLMETRRCLYGHSGVLDRIFSLLMLFFGTSVALPELIAHFTNPDADFEDFTHALYLLAVAVYALVRLIAEHTRPASDIAEVPLSSSPETEDSLSEPSVTELTAEPTEDEEA